MKTACSIILSTLIFSCAPHLKTLSFEGDASEITLGNDYTFTAELMMVTDSAIYVKQIGGKLKSPSTSSGKIYQIPFADIREINIEGYVNKGWLPAVLLFQFLPAVLLTVAASSAGAELSGGGVLLLYGPPVITFLLFSTSQPDPPRFTALPSAAEIAELRKYARYRTELDAEQWRIILQKHGQTAPKSF